MSDAIPPIDIRPDHWEIVLDVLEKHVPDYEVWAFGSRAKWNAKQYSDLDLAILTDKPLPLAVSAALTDDFSESDLPWKVDVVDWATTSESFRKIIERDKVVVQEGGASLGIPSEWRDSTLGDVTDFLSGGTPSKSRPDYWNGSIPWVSAKDMKQFRLEDTEDHITDDGASNGTRLAPANSVLLLVRGMTLLNDLPICVLTKPMAFNQDVKALRPTAHVTSGFLPYLLLGNKDRLLSRVDLAGHGTGRLNSGELRSLEIGLPPKTEQRAIAHILGTLDDKIELNRRRNRTLEDMARALFKDWFVDFGPVRAKMEGREPYLPADLWELFPERLNDDEKPEGWEQGRLDDALTLQRGFDLPASERTHGEYPVMAASGVNGYHDKFMVKGPGITTGRSGVLGRVFFVHGDFWPLNTSLWVKEFKKVSPAFAFHLLRGLDFEVFNAGSAVPTLNRNHVHNLPIVIPPAKLIQEFDRQVMPMLILQKANEDESRTLARQRDTLLPKLISGELRVQDAEKFVGSVHSQKSLSRRNQP